MSRITDIGGEASTFCRLRLWNESNWDYDEVVACVKHQDARPDYLKLHCPPMSIVLWVRYDREVVRP